MTAIHQLPDDANGSGIARACDFGELAIRSRRLVPFYGVSLLAVVAVGLRTLPAAWMLVLAAVGLGHLCAHAALILLAGSRTKTRGDARQAAWRRAMMASAAMLGLVCALLAAATFMNFGPAGHWLLTLALHALSIAMMQCGDQRLFLAFHIPAHAALAFAWMQWGGYLALAVVNLMFVANIIYFSVIAPRRRLAAAPGAQALSHNEALVRSLSMRNAALDANVRSKTSLLAAASHDLRQPVHALGMLVNLIDPDDRDSVRERIKAVQGCVDSLSDMLAEMLEYNRLELGLYQPRPQPVALAHLLEQVRDSFSVAARAKGLVLHVRSTKAVVLSDEGLLRRALFNLTSNAIRYTSQGHVWVRVKAVGAQLCIEVSDTGVGIAPERLEQIFTAYVRSPSQRAEWAEGLGLGLTIVQRAVELLGQRITVRSELGHGSVFSIGLGPALLAQPPAPETLPAAPLVPAAGQRVVVLDNDLFARGGMCDILRQWGFDPVGAEGWRALSHDVCEHPDDVVLVISDYHLGSAEGHGLDAIDQLRLDLNRPVPAILLTGDLDPLLDTMAGEHHTVLAHKPMRPAALRKLVDRALERQA